MKYSSLLDIVYCSVSGISNLPEIAHTLQSDLLKAISDSELTMKSFSNESEIVINSLNNVYPCFSENDIKTGIQLLAKTADIARKMTDKSIEMKNTFLKCLDQTETVLHNTYSNNQKLLEKKDEIQNQIAEVKAELASMEILQQILQEQIENMNHEYIELSKKAESAEKRAYSLELTGAIMGGLGGLISNIFPIKDLVSSVSETPQTSETDSFNTDDVNPADNSKIQSVEKEVQDLKSKKDALTREINSLTEEIKAHPSDMEQKRELLKKKQEEYDKTEQEIIAQEKTIEKVSTALKNIGNSFTTAAEHQNATLESYNKRLEELYRLQQEVKSKDATNKASITKYKETLAASVNNRANLEIPLQALTVSISSMRRIVTILNEVILFWKSIEACCEALANTKFWNEISIDENQQKFYEKRMFVQPFADYHIQWEALYLVCLDYVDSMNEVRTKLSDTIAQAEGEPELQWDKAIQKAKNLKVI
ncbi:hypothetical protein [Amedibacterium intestinale]|uniref:hypothetical protein n=1 Tax=Amedibacterium intestinale TaxID=2583452 RepID=UPI001373C03E|nr:hypothetical protein [Amedibacterium intestinale]BBK63267.1 hypothetical protein A9CBEGH2_22070 [Amedibacterium intestinale]